MLTRNEILLCITDAEAAGDHEGAEQLRKSLTAFDDKVRTDALMELHPERYPKGERRWPIKHHRVVTESGKKVWLREYLD